MSSRWGALQSSEVHRWMRGCEFPRLLHDMRELVRQQTIAGGRSGRIFAGRERNIAAERVGAGIDRARAGLRAGVGVNAHVGKIAPEALLEIAASIGRERRAAPASADAAATAPLAAEPVDRGLVRIVSSLSSSIDRRRIVSASSASH